MSDALEGIKRREARRQAMIQDGSYRITQMRCNDPDRHGTYGSHPENVRPETSLHGSYISHLEALADSVQRLIAAVEAVENRLDRMEIEGYTLTCAKDGPSHRVGLKVLREAKKIRAALTSALGDDNERGGER